MERLERECERVNEFLGGGRGIFYERNIYYFLMWCDVSCFL